MNKGEMNMDQVELQTILEKHKKWLLSEDGGKRADLHGADLHGANLCGVNLSCADLSGINLNCANLIEADLSGANLNCANLSRADLGHADLHGADFNGADLHEANLTYVDLTWAYLNGADLHAANLAGAHLDGAELNGANLESADLNGVNLTGAHLNKANLCNVKYNDNTASYALACPEKGSFIGFKRASDKIVELMITENAKRSSATTRKCRCSEAVVLSITNPDGTKFDGDKVISDYDNSFVYEIGKTVSVNDFDDDRWNECSTGIHFFLTRDEAVRY